MKHVKDPSLNSPQKMMLTITKEDIVVEKEELIINRDIRNKEIMREKK